MSIQQLSAADATTLSFNSGTLSTSSNRNRVRENAIQFEALLIGQVLDKLEHTFSSADNHDADPAHDTVSSLGTHAVAELLAHRRAFGFANMLERALPEAQSSQASPK